MQDLFAEPTPRGIPGYNHPARGGYGAPQAGFPGGFPGAQQGFPGSQSGFPGAQHQFPGMQQQPQGMFPYGQGIMTPNGLMQARPGMPPQGIPGVPGHMMPQAGFGGYPPQPGMPNSLLPSGPSQSGFGGTPGMFPGQNGFPGQPNHPGGYPQQPGAFPGQAGFPGQQPQQQMAGYGGPMSNSITGEYRGQFPPGTPGGPPPGVNPAGPENHGPILGAGAWIEECPAEPIILSSCTEHCSSWPAAIPPILWGPFQRPLGPDPRRAVRCIRGIPGWSRGERLLGS